MLSRAGRRAAEKRNRRMRTAGAALAAGAATFGTTAALVGATAGSAGASTLEVTNCNATGAGSLHDVVEGANSGDVVAFNTGGCASITLNDDIDISKSVTIRGPGASAFTVSGNNAMRIFSIESQNPAINVTISGLTLTGGNANEGGAIAVHNAAKVSTGTHLTVADSIITQNTSTGDGGGIHVGSPNASLTVQSTTISGNTAKHWGDAIYFYGDNGVVTIANSNLSNNTATSGGGATWMGGEDSSKITITNTVVTGNTATNSDGGGLALWYADMAITGSTSNKAADDRGCGLYIQDARNVNIDSSTISGNTAGDGGGAWIYNTQGNLNITNTAITGNTGTASGGAWIYGVRAIAPTSSAA